MTTSFLLIIQIILVVILTIAVLLQKSSSIGLGAYSGSNDSVFGAKGPNSFLAKATFTIGFLFVVNTITLGYLYAQANQASVIDDMLPSTHVVAPTATPTESITEVTEETTTSTETTAEATSTETATETTVEQEQAPINK